jgi:Zn-dependent protease
MFLQTLVTDPLLFCRIIVILIFSICLHELAHGIVAIAQGDDTPKKSGHMTLNPVVHMGLASIIFLCLAGIAWGQMPVDTKKFRNPRLGNILVSAAGPGMNLGLSLLAIALLKVVTTQPWGEWISGDFLLLMAILNVSLFLFNLLPIPPLDGFHVWSEFFPSLKPLEQTPFGMFALMVLFITPQVGEGLGQLSSAIVVFLYRVPFP